MSSSLLEIKDISLSFGRSQVFNKISTEIHQGQRSVFIGPSGSGKSCLLKILCGIISPSSGDVLWEEQSFYHLAEVQQKRWQSSMGMLFQQNALFDSLTVYENVAFPLKELTQQTSSEISEKVLFFLNEVGLEAARDLFPGEISGGMQKRVGIARALVLNPKIIFYDDPTAGLDPITSRQITKMICSLQEAQKSSIFVVTNDMNRAFDVAHQIYMIMDQKLICIGSPAEAKNHPDPRVNQFVKGLLIDNHQGGEV